MKLFKMEELSLQDCTHVTGAGAEGGESTNPGGSYNEESNSWCPEPGNPED